jgi:hypothetical protein
MFQQEPRSLALTQRLSDDEMEAHLHQGRVAELRCCIQVVSRFLLSVKGPSS